MIKPARRGTGSGYARQGTNHNFAQHKLAKHVCRVYHQVYRVGP